MKKTLTVLASAVLALGMLFVSGCKMNAKLGDNTSNAGSKVKDATKKIYITAEEYPIDWWVLTNEKNVVLQSGTDIAGIKNYDKQENTVSGTHSYRTTINKGSGVEVTLRDSFFSNSDKKDNAMIVNVYIRQKGRTLKGKIGNDTKEGKDLFTSVANVTVSLKDGAKTSDKKIADTQNSIRNQVCTLKITCDETRLTDSYKAGQIVKINGTSCQVGHWHGSYAITQIWPLTWDPKAKVDHEEKPATNGAYVAIQDLMFNGVVIDEGKTVEIIYPAKKKAYLALKQPDRFDSNKDTAAEEVQENYFWCVALDEIAPYDVFPIKSSKCTLKLKDNVIYSGSGELHSITPDRSAVGGVYFVSPDAFIEAANEK